MKTKNAQIKVGVIVLLSIAIVIFTIIWGKNYKLTKTYHPFTIFFPNVLGLEEGAQVLINGMTMGRVKHFHLRNEGVMVDVVVIKDVEIYDDAAAIIETPGFIDEKVVIIDPGVSGNVLPEGAQIPGKSPPTFTQLLAYLNHLGDNLGVTLSEITQVSSNLNSIIENPEIMGNVISTLDNLTATTNNLNAMIVDSKPGVDSTLHNMTRLSSKAVNLVDKYEADIDTIFGNLVVLSGELHNMAATVNEFSNSINNKNSSLGKVMTNDDLYNDLRRVTANLDTLITEFRKNGVKTKLKIF